MPSYMMICLRNARCSAVHRKELLSLVRRTRSNETFLGNQIIGDEAAEHVTKVKNLYKTAYALTNGRPSPELLEALEQQAKCDGVKITRKELHDFEYEELILQNRSRQSKIRPITGTSTNKIQLLNAYLDVFLNKNELDEFLSLIQRSPAISNSIDLVDRSILMRYIIRCRKDFRVHHLAELPDHISVVDKIMGHYYQRNLSLLKNISVNQKFIDEIVANYSFYRNDFRDFENAIRIIDSSLVFSVTNEKRDIDYLKKKYPLIKNLLSPKSKSNFPYHASRVSAASIKSQLQNEKHEYTQLQSISCETQENPSVWKYKAMLQKKWEDRLYKALCNESKLYKKGDHRDFRMHNCPFLDEDIVCLRTVAHQTVNYICEQLVLQYKGIEVSRSLLPANMHFFVKFYAFIIVNLLLSLKSHQKYFLDHCICKCSWKYSLQDLL